MMMIVIVCRLKTSVEVTHLCKAGGVAVRVVVGCGLGEAVVPAKKGDRQTPAKSLG